MNQSIFDRVARYVAIRERSEFEVRNYLKRKQASETEIEAVIQKCIRMKLINNKRFAQSILRQTLEYRKKGKSLLLLKLKMAGLDSSLISETLGEVTKDQIAQALRLRAQKYTPKLARYPENQHKLRLANHLSRAGFNASEIWSFIDDWAKTE